MPSTRLLLTALGASAVLSAAEPNNQQQAPLVGNDYVCEHPPYKPLIVSKSPLVIYLQDFITPSERAHLLKLGETTFTRSGTTANSANTSLRTSQSTTVPPSDPVVACIESRALAFQGFDVPRTHLEPLQLVKYGPTEHFHFHTDWFPPRGPHAAVDVGGNRVSSFFVYVQVEPGTTGGGTNFPRLDALADERWCAEGIVDCDEPWENGLTFRAVEGNAVFWVNLEEDGRGNELSVRRGDERTLHAGLPVVTGGKVGMNIWTREGPVEEDIRGTGL